MRALEIKSDVTFAKKDIVKKIFCCSHEDQDWYS